MKRRIAAALQGVTPQLPRDGGFGARKRLGDGAKLGADIAVPTHAATDAQADILQALVALGYRALSLAPTAVGPVKAMLLELDAGKVTALVNPLLDGAKHKETVRQALEGFAAAEGLQL